MRIQTVIREGLQRAGVYVTRFPPHHMASRLLQDLFQEHRINVVLDVGGELGHYCTMLRKEVGYKGLIISFEPCAESFQLLKSARSKDKNWRGYQFGLGTKDGTAQLNRYNERGFNSLLNLREETAAPYGVEVSSQVENVQIRRLDTVWDEIMTDIRSPNVFLKTDTQGMDIPIVSGAASRLHCVYGIQCELPTIEMYEGMVPLPEALQFLRNLGYLPAGFYPQAERAAFGVAPEFDVVFKRPKSQAFLTRTRDCPSV